MKQHVRISFVIGLIFVIASCLGGFLLSEMAECSSVLMDDQEEILKTNSGDEEKNNTENDLFSSLLFGTTNGWVSILMIFIVVGTTSLLTKGTEISNLVNNYLLSRKEINKDRPKKRVNINTNTSENNNNTIEKLNQDGENIRKNQQSDEDLEHITPSRVIKPILVKSINHVEKRKLGSAPLDLISEEQKRKVDLVANLSESLKDCDNINMNVKFYEPVAVTPTNIYSSGRYGLDLEDEDDNIPPIPIDISRPERRIIPVESTLEEFSEIYSKKSIPTSIKIQTTQTPIIHQQDTKKALEELHIRKQNSRQNIEKELAEILKLVECENEEIRKVEQERLVKIKAEQERIAKIKAEQERIAREKLEEERRKAAEEEEKKRQAAIAATAPAEINVSPIKPQQPNSIGTAEETPAEKSDISIVNPYSGPKKTLTVPNFTRPKTYVIAKIYVDRMEEMYASFQKRMDPQLKPEMDAAKKLINKTINRITETNQREIVKEINQIMSKQKVKKDVFYFCLYFYARTIVDQAASQTSDLKKVLPFIEVTSELMNDSPEILDAVIGYIHTNCIFTIPYFPYEVTDASDLKKKLGFKEEDGEMESQSQYMNRMNDIITIYAMIIQNNPPGHKYGIEKGWEWLAAFLNSRPTMFTLEILDSFLRIAGYKMHQIYKAQFAKILEFIEVHLLANPPKGSDKASLSRFSDLIGNFKKSKQMPKPSFLE
ncbi:predicted protein [Naegleria gruberi]|uniref:mRNA export factor GLE1 n=1 Tax=Naegleria gruberi TaxID=5762 RepID=D2UZL9_NAEGR|nr:uncharacterized protein NAEGRDRAFT_61988 [Naegleria gruberi]EFC50178.1 predicted protein [Naegleria gruberi]|eukprot:XP_002682922.1 predicted protein [Naegleria gruberi strain NEG-M]